MALVVRHEKGNTFMRTLIFVFRRKNGIFPNFRNQQGSQDIYHFFVLTFSLTSLLFRHVKSKYRFSAKSKTTSFFSFSAAFSFTGFRSLCGRPHNARCIKVKQRVGCQMHFSGIKIVWIMMTSTYVGFRFYFSIRKKKNSVSKVLRRTEGNVRSKIISANCGHDMFFFLREAKREVQSNYSL